MKSLLIVATLALSANAFSSEALIKLSRNSGFSPLPSSSVLSVFETGKVQLVSNHGSAVTKSQLKDISPNTVQAIKDNVEAINAKAEVIDLDANKPRCMDAPSSEITVKKNGKDVTIATFYSCHRAQMKSKAATDIIKLIQDIDSKR